MDAMARRLFLLSTPLQVRAGAARPRARAAHTHPTVTCRRPQRLDATAVLRLVEQSVLTMLSRAPGDDAAAAGRPGVHAGGASFRSHGSRRPSREHSALTVLSRAPSDDAAAAGRPGMHAGASFVSHGSRRPSRTAGAPAPTPAALRAPRIVPARDRPVVDCGGNLVSV